MKIRNGLLLGAAFAAGVMVGPGAPVLEHQFGLSLPIAHARAQDRQPRRDLPAADVCSATCSSACAPNMSSR